MVPQILMIILIAAGIGISIKEHGKPREGNESVWIHLISVAISIGLLIWGGFFNVFIK